MVVMFKRRRFSVEIILVCVRWYCKYGISYRDLAEMMQERGVEVAPSTLFRWVQRYAPKLEKRVRWYQGYRSTSWRVDETYIKVGGRWTYLFQDYRQAWHADRLYAFRPPQYACCAPLSRLGTESDAQLATIVDHNRQAPFIS
jgi:hypothetical protein